MARTTESHDLCHGPAAARLVRCLARRHKSDPRMEVLAEAIDGYSDGWIDSQVTVGTCWDADRLDLWRFDVEPGLLSMPAARSEEMLAMTAALQSDEQVAQVAEKWLSLAGY